MDSVLILSDGYLPLRRVSWQEAICDVLAGRAEVLEVYAGRYIHTVSETIPMPSVIRFVKKVYAFFSRAIRRNRRNLWLRDHGKCQYCGKKVSASEFEEEHVIPRSQGGQTNWENLVVSCTPCNQRKKDRTPEQAGMRLLSKPVQPASVLGPGFAPAWETAHLPTEWKPYLGL